MRGLSPSRGRLNLASAWVACAAAWLARPAPAAWADEPTAPPAAASRPEGEKPPAERPAAEFTTVVVRGRVTWLAEAARRGTGVASVPEAAERVLAIETDDGELHPLLEDRRGRAFRVDPQLREKPLRVLARRYAKHPFLQVLWAREITAEGEFDLDYWCDICSISMVEFGPCDCCQEVNRLRKQRADKPLTP